MRDARPVLLLSGAAAYSSSLLLCCCCCLASSLSPSDETAPANTTDAPALSNTESTNAWDNVYYDLYTRNSSNKPERLYDLNPNTLKSTSFDFKKPTIFLVHGWLALNLNPFSAPLRKAFLRQGDCNVIHVTYSMGKFSNYNAVTGYVPSVGRKIGLAINDLLRTGVDPANITIAGFSLGGHVAGVAGQHTKVKVGRVIGLDPTGINYRNVPESKRISVKSATYVEVIHTSGLLGLPEAIGHVDFFVNGGQSQPCFSLTMPDCSHPRSLDYYMEAMFNNRSYIGVRCSNFGDFNKDKCDGDEVGMAAKYNPKNPFKRGKYYLYTSDRSPFGLGEQGTWSKNERRRRRLSNRSRPK